MNRFPDMEPGKFPWVIPKSARKIVETTPTLSILPIVRQGEIRTQSIVEFLA